jgi:hypothetical protein
MNGRVMGIAAALAVSAAFVLPALAVSASTSEHGYVTSKMVLPATSTEARSLGRDIDRDGDRDNRLGSSSLSSRVRARTFRALSTRPSPTGITTW